MRYRVVHFDSLTSTNDVVLDAARAGAKPGLVVRSNIQTHGKGRKTRDWASPEGGLWTSIVLEPGVPSRFRGLVPLGVGIACCRALNGLGANVELKWPNDLMIGDDKLGGILVESVSTEGELALIVAGIGINVTNEPPIDEATSLRQLGISATPRSLLEAILEELESLEDLLSGGQAQQLCQGFMDHAWGIGREMLLDGERCKPKEIAVDGALIVEDTDGSISVHRSGSLRLP